MFRLYVMLRCQSLDSLNFYLNLLDLSLSSSVRLVIRLGVYTEKRSCMNELAAWHLTIRFLRTDTRVYINSVLLRVYVEWKLGKFFDPIDRVDATHAEWTQESIAPKSRDSRSLDPSDVFSQCNNGAQYYFFPSVDRCTTFISHVLFIRRPMNDDWLLYVRDCKSKFATYHAYVIYAGHFLWRRVSRVGSSRWRKGRCEEIGANLAQKFSEAEDAR